MNADIERYPPIGDYGLIGDMHTAALVSKAGSIDWCCFPRFDSEAVFGRLLDWDKGGYFAFAPKGIVRTTRRYLPNTNVLETTFETDTGRVTLTDFMPVIAITGPNRPRDLTSRRQIIRRMVCERGSVEFEMRCMPRFDYGGIVPHASLLSANLGLAHGGKDAISMYSSAPMREEDDGFSPKAGSARATLACVAPPTRPVSLTTSSRWMSPNCTDVWMRPSSSGRGGQPAAPTKAPTRVMSCVQRSP